VPRLHAYYIQLRHEIKPLIVQRVTFTDFMLSETVDNEGYLQWVMFADLPFTSTAASIVTNDRIWGSQ
jgi:hypothetical protein